MKKLKEWRASMSVNVIGGLVAMVLLFGLVVCLVGYHCIVSAFKNEYSSVTYHMADSAAVFVNGDHIYDYLAGEQREEYAKTRRQLDVCCQKLNVSLIYVIKVDQSDYGSFLSIFNPVNNSVDNSSYTEWELGYQRNTTNEEYRQKYRAIYEEGSPCETVFRFRTTDGQHPHITTLVPVKNAAGEVTAILCMQRPIREMQDAIRPYLFYIISGVLFMVVLISALAGVFLRRSIIRPVEKVSREAMRFAKEHAISAPLGEIGSYEVIRGLARSIDSMETDMLEYVDDLTAATAEKERIGAELSIAASIQQDTLPKERPAFPDRNEFDIYAFMDPAKEVGGDFYNYFLIDDDHLALVMADAAGKGIPAALFTQHSNALIFDRAMRGGTPAEILSSVNRMICRRNSTEMFVTVWLGILEISTGRLTAANAGHECPVICRKGGGVELIKSKHGLVLGGMEGVRYKDIELRLNKGDKLFLYTDGIPEATDGEGRMYTIERMLDALGRHGTESPEGVLAGVERSVREFVGGAAQFDDLTMLCLELKDEAEEPA